MPKVLKVGETLVEVKEEREYPSGLLERLIGLLRAYLEGFFEIKDKERLTKEVHREIQNLLEVFPEISRVEFPREQIRVAFTWQEKVVWNLPLLEALFPNEFGEQIQLEISLQTSPLSLSLPQKDLLLRKLLRLFGEFGVPQELIKVDIVPKVEGNLPLRNFELPQELKKTEKILFIRPKRG